MESIIEKGEQDSDVKEIVKEAFRLSIGLEESSPAIAKKPKKVELKNKHDLRLIVLEGKEKGLSAHEALKEKGIIKTIENDFFSVG
ncbi:hypothetical protein JQN58_01555 [Aneurinibacillus sp. BA2021]|nr:hypothetical protein [Aneurinibacillus sp. BA2021]